MKITISREKLLKALQKVISTIGARTTLPVLNNVLLETGDGRLVLTTTDLEIRITTGVEATVVTPGETTLPAKKLLALVSKFNDDEVSIDVDERHHAQIVCGTSRFKLLGISSEDFPKALEFETVRTMVFKGSDLKRMLGQIVYAVSLEDSRKVLHGILCSVKEHMVTLAATDGRRLALVEKVPESVEGADGDVIIPLRAAAEIRRMVENDVEIKMEIGEKLAAFETAETRLSSKLIEGNYPNFRQVIPGKFNQVLNVPAIPFLQKLELVKQVLSDNSSFVMLGFGDNELTIQASSSEIGEGKAVLEIAFEGERIDASFNPDFLIDPLRCCETEDITIKLNDGFSPVAMIGGEGFLYVIMPMRNK